MLDPLSILVVGGAGYIGSQMVLALQDAGHKAIIFDNCSRSGIDISGQKFFFEGDLLSPNDLNDCFKKYNIDLVMHFAAFAYVHESVVNPSIYYENNVAGTINLLKAMVSHSKNKIVFSSTCAIYGEPEYLPIDENHPKKPLNPYGKSKLMIEDILSDFSEAYGIQSISLRYFNAAGCDSSGRTGESHNPETHLIPLVLNEAMRLKTGGNPADTMLSVFGGDFNTRDGSCIRDYIHVEDLCEAHILAADRLVQKQVNGSEYYNLANGNGFTVLEIIKACEEVTNQFLQYKVEARRKGDSEVLIGDSSKALQVLKWKPKYTNIQPILETAWNWILANHKG